MTETEQLAHRAYKLETSTSTPWLDLPEHTRQYYMGTARAIQFLSKQVGNTIDTAMLDEVMQNVRAGRECRY